jgi:nucleoside-diphosphate-sugar epimerase
MAMGKMAVTGGAGFIGSNLAECLAGQGYEVVIVDNFSSGKEENLRGWADRAADRVQIVRADINQTDNLRSVFKGVRFVFHLAAIPSVPRSIADPMDNHTCNISGTLSVLLAARDAKVERVVLASSSAIYGDDPGLPKVENRVGRPLSPYALSKIVSEEYCRLFFQLYGLETTCLRYFNIFGPRQDPASEYAAVIPKFATRMISGKAPIIYGDGEQTRDFTFVSNVLDANWRAATHPNAVADVFNVGCGIKTSLNEVVHHFNRILGTHFEPIYEPARVGDVRHSVADVSKAAKALDYTPATPLHAGLEKVVAWYRKAAE